MPSDAVPAVAGVVLAAGDSSRMGRNKLLLEIDGEPAVRRAVRQAVGAGLSPVLVVTGFDADSVRGALAGLPFQEVHNPWYQRGIKGSLRLGMTAVPARVRAAVVVLADMPLVTGPMITALVARYRASGAPLVISEYGGVQAPPTLYDRSLFAEFEERDGEGGGREVVSRHRDEAVVVEWPAAALADLDVPGDVERVTGQSPGPAA